jgi:hypothetical protein
VQQMPDRNAYLDGLLGGSSVPGAGGKAPVRLDMRIIPTSFLGRLRSFGERTDRQPTPLSLNNGPLLSGLQVPCKPLRFKGAINGRFARKGKATRREGPATNLGPSKIGR